jgi:glucan phosphoethanolaminetransferase (alkaline phosphatase superfamily)
MEKKERTVTRVSDGKKTVESVKKTAKKVDDAVEEVTEETAAEKKLTKEEKKKKATTYRIISICLWVVAIAMEVLAILCISKTLYIGIPLLWSVIIFIVVDLACCLVAAFLWKKSNRLDPIKKTNNKVGFFLMTQLGLIMAVVCFLPLVILILINKDMDKKTKTILSVVAIAALLLVGALSADYNPISKEEADAAEAVITSDVYWTSFGHKYHTSDSCQALTNSSNLFVGSVSDAIEAGREDLCAFCARRDNIDTTGLKVEEAAGQE